MEVEKGRADRASKAGRSPRTGAKAEALASLRAREVRISEQLAYQLLAFLSRYQADVQNLIGLLNASDLELLPGYLEAMAYGDCQDAERLAKALQRAVDALDEGGDV